MYGFYRAAAVTPVMRVGDTNFNANEIIVAFRQCAEQKCAAVVFPELAVTGYSCGDLFFQQRLLDDAKTALRNIIDATANTTTVLIVGLPWREDSALYNAAAVIQNGSLKGVVFKSVIPNYREFYEQRNFRSGNGFNRNYLRFDNLDVPAGTGMVFDDGCGFSFGIEICEDLWSVIPPSSYLALNGAKLIFNLSASTALVGKADYRRKLVAQQSGRTLSGYILSGAGVHESTADVVYGGHSLIAVNGAIVRENERFDRSTSIISADIDLEALNAARMSESSFNDARENCSITARKVDIEPVAEADELQYIQLSPRPFVPDCSADRQERCREIFQIQCAGLAKRIEHTKAETMVVGLSGGLDSTLALLVAVETCRILKRDTKSIITITMPGFGTTERTRSNSEKLAELLNTTLRKIDIRTACRQHFADIGHDENNHNVVFENTQARERTQILMDVANAAAGLVIGTGDLSEIALGWSTFNGDHMAMYSVNCSIPKTLIRYVIAEYAARTEGEIAEVLNDVLATPVSPELLPADKNGEITQKTEEILGAYELHDFFLYHFIKTGASPEKLQFLAKYAFEGRYDDKVIYNSLKIFIRRFWSMQFKRNSSPDGPKVGSIALSPRGDWRMPSDAVPPEF